MFLAPLAAGLHTATGGYTGVMLATAALCTLAAVTLWMTGGHQPR